MRVTDLQQGEKERWCMKKQERERVRTLDERRRAHKYGESVHTSVP